MEECGLIQIFHSHAQARRHSFRNHHHSAFEISLIISGSGIYRVREIEYEISAGDIYLYNTNEPHCITDIDEREEMHILNIHFEPRYFWFSVNEIPAMEYLQVFSERSKSEQNRLPISHPLNAALRELIFDIEREWQKRKSGYEILIKIRILNMLVLLSRDAKSSTTVEKHDLNSTQLQQIGKSMDYIVSHIEEELSLEQIARSAHMSRTYYCSVFKSLNGITPWDYVNIKRVEKAMRLLRETEDLILGIALGCGFNNTSNFNRIFKKVTGLTPKEYRNAHKK